MTDAAELRRQLAEAEERERQAILAAAKAIPMEWEWKIAWKGTYSFYCCKRLSEGTLNRIKEWERANPRLTFPKPHGGERWEGMTYLLVGNLLFYVGGGTLILKGKEGEDAFSHEPRELTDHEAELLKSGMVPDSLMR